MKESPSMPPAQKARYGRLATFVLLLLLMAMMALQILRLPLLPGAVAVLLAVVLLPLALFLYPLWRGRAQAALWLGLLLMPYFCWAVLGAFVPGTEGRLAVVRSLLIAACFTAAMLMVRWQRAADSAGPGNG